MRYATARYNLEQRCEAYRIYVSDGLYCIANTLHGFAGGGPSLNTRYVDLLHPAPEKPKDERTQDDIVAQVWRSIRGETN